MPELTSESCTGSPDKRWLSAATLDEWLATNTDTLPKEANKALREQFDRTKIYFDLLRRLKSSILALKDVMSAAATANLDHIGRKEYALEIDKHARVVEQAQSVRPLEVHPDVKALTNYYLPISNTLLANTNQLNGAISADRAELQDLVDNCYVDGQLIFG